MKFTKHYIVKWHDTDVNRLVRPSQILMYMQETANEHLRACAVSLDEFRDRQGLAFLLSSISICVYEPLYTNDEIEVQTWICEGRGLSHNRCFSILRNGVTVVEAFSVWALMNLREHKLLKSDEVPYHLEPDAALQLSVLPRRLRVPSIDQMELVGERRIVYSDLDYNRHMNNTHYPDMFCDFMPDVCESRVTGMMLSFLHEAAYGHVLKVYRTATEGGYLFRTVDENGNACTDALLRVERIRTLQEDNRF